MRTEIRAFKNIGDVSPNCGCSTGWRRVNVRGMRYSGYYKFAITKDGATKDVFAKYRRALQKVL